MSGARGVALFTGCFSLINAAAMLAGSRAAGDAWWIDFAPLPAWLFTPLAMAAAIALILWALRPAGPRPVRVAAGAAASVLAGFALVDSVRFAMAVASRTVRPVVPVPFTALVAVALAWTAAMALGPRVPSGRAALPGALAVAAALVVVFPLAQVLFFGTTDYRRPADAAVVFGAKAYANGTLSTSLEDRVRTACDLYRAGLVPRLVMSGAVGESGADETVAMRDRAVQLGVPASAILLDPQGVDTEASARDTVPMLEALGCRRVLAVSQFYHLPRIKMAYRTYGMDVQTVPATVSRPIPQTPALVLREVGGFWVYWARGLLGGMPGDAEAHGAPAGDAGA